MDLGLGWIILIIVCIVIEALTLGLTTIWFSIGAIAAWIANISGFEFTIQLIIFLIISIVCLIFTRPIAIKKLKVGRVKTNIDSLIGECFKVRTTINNINNEGTVNVRGQIWEARSFNSSDIIDKDEIVCVKEIIGVKLIVERKNK
jgi:membrane protein implicated in regulation of membrane protease activity